MFKKLFAPLTSLILLGACASKADKKFHENLAKAPETSTTAETRKNVTTIIQNSSHLTDAQKEKLLALQEKTQTEAAALYQEGLKIQEMLALEYTKENTSDKAIRTIKKHMIQNSRARLNLIFSALSEADKIIGRKVIPNHTELMSTFYNEHGGSSR